MKRIRGFKIVLAIIIFVTLTISGIAFAAGTPSWWDNPDGYTSWTQTIGDGTAANTGPVAQDVLITMDIDNTQIPDNTKEVWMQVEWSEAVGTGYLRSDRIFIQWTNSPCPPSPKDPFPKPIGSGFMTYEGAMAGGPEWGYQNGDEFSYSIGVQPQCERIIFSFSVDPNSEIDYRAEVQTLCFTPTAIVLKTFSDAPWRSAIWVVALVFGLVALAAGAALISRRRTNSTS